MEFNAELIEEFLTALRVELNRSENTIKGYRKDLMVFKDFVLQEKKESVPLAELTANLLGEYIQHLARERLYQARTIRRHVAALKSFFGYLEDAEYIETNPASDLVNPRCPDTEPNYLYRSEVMRLFAAIPVNTKTALRDRSILMTLFYTGVRVAELVNLRREDICFAEKYVVVRKGKGAKYRRVPLHPVLERQLLLYLERCEVEAEGYLFTNGAGGRLSTEYIRQITERYARAAGIRKKVTPHVLRHTYATLLYRSGVVDIMTLSRLLGHSGLRNTTVYIHSDIEHLRTALEKLPSFEIIQRRLSNF